MTAIAIVLLQVLACLGLGVVTLRLTAVQTHLSAGEQFTWSFAIGFGLLGWLLFFAGVSGAFTGPVLLLVLAVPVAAVALFRFSLLSKEFADGIGRASPVVVGAAILVVVMDAFEVPAPVTDADSIAYHFDLPRRFWEAGAVFFVPRALDGAAPLLVQMTYVAPYAFGGETALNLWTMITGLAASLLVYTVCRRYLTPTWSLGILIVFATTPAVVYGAGSGQVEVRLAMFAIVAAMAAGEALRRDQLGFVVVAGLAAGFFAGGKYFGLLFGLATGLSLLCKSDFLKRGAVYGAAAVAAGFQWYWWNWLHTGDPVFPMLFPVLGDAGTGYWGNANHRVLLDWLSTFDRAVPVNIFWFFAYPFVATLKGLPALESTRTGFGPFVLLILPLALAGAWVHRRSLRRGPMLTACAIAIVTYGLWFFLASSQRVRYVLPVYPLLLIVVSVAAIRFSEKASLVRPAMAALALTCLIQMTGQALFSVRYVRFAIIDQDRDSFYAQGVGRYSVVKWINTHLGRDAVVMTPYRDMMFLLTPRVFQAHPFDQAVVNVLPGVTDPRGFIRQVRDEGVTHAIVNPRATGGYEAGYTKMVSAALAAGCFAVVAEVPAETRGSRTLPTLSSRRELVRIVKRTDDTCRL